jgi:hypothetical protein
VPGDEPRSRDRSLLRRRRRRRHGGSRDDRLADADSSLVRLETKLMVQPVDLQRELVMMPVHVLP